MYNFGVWAVVYGLYCSQVQSSVCRGGCGLLSMACNVVWYSRQCVEVGCGQLSMACNVVRYSRQCVEVCVGCCLWPVM